MTADTRRRGTRLAAAVGALVLFATALPAQTRPPIPGVTAAETPEGAGDGATAAIGAAARKAVEGTRGLLRAIGLGGGDESPEADPFKTLELGSAVIVRSSTDAGAFDDLTIGTEGRVIDLDRRAGAIVVRLADRTTRNLRLDKRPATRTEASQDPGDEIVRVSWVVNGDRVSALFRKVS